MAQQPSYHPLVPSAFFADGRSARPPVPGTIAQGQLRDDRLLFTGKEDNRKDAGQAAALLAAASVNTPATPGFAELFVQSMAIGAYADFFPFPVSATLLDRGRQRYAIFCALCHDPSGNGNGKIVQRGFTRPPSYNTDFARGFERRGIKVLLRDVPVGYYFEVITRGFGAMADYASQISPEDRWAIIAYIRALQLSQFARVKELPPEVQQEAQKELEKGR
jgi:mono/diheme cytochrome c family protein